MSSVYESGSDQSETSGEYERRMGNMPMGGFMLRLGGDVPTVEAAPGYAPDMNVASPLLAAVMQLMAKKELGCSKPR